MKNANIKSIEEAKKRLENGEVFYLNEYILYYQDSYMLKGESPYRFKHKLLGNVAITGAWYSFEDWQVESKWYDNIPEQGILCFVSDTKDLSFSEFGKGTLFDIIMSYHSLENYFSGKISDSWQYARPVTEDEIKQYILK